MKFRKEQEVLCKNLKLFEVTKRRRQLSATKSFNIHNTVVCRPIKVIHYKNALLADDYWIELGTIVSLLITLVHLKTKNVLLMRCILLVVIYLTNTVIMLTKYSTKSSADSTTVIPRYYRCEGSKITQFPWL